MVISLNLPYYYHRLLTGAKCGRRWCLLLVTGVLVCLGYAAYNTKNKVANYTCENDSFSPSSLMNTSTSKFSNLHYSVVNYKDKVLVYMAHINQKCTIDNYHTVFIIII